MDSKPLWSLEDDVGLTTHDEEVNDMRAAFGLVQAEADSLNQTLWEPIRLEFVPEDIDPTSYAQFPLYTWSQRRHHHCSLAPQTCALLKKFEAATKRCPKCVAKFVKVGPKTRLLPHTGPTNARLRIVLPLRAGEGAGMRVGKKDAVSFAEGQFMVFDDSYEHEVWNEGEKDLLLLSVDVPHPDDGTAGKTKFGWQAKATYHAY